MTAPTLRLVVDISVETGRERLAVIEIVDLTLTPVTLGYTAGYLPRGLEPIGLCIYNVQVPIGRREIIIAGTVDLTVLRVFIS
jgi:hypothetical protein